MYKSVNQLSDTLKSLVKNIKIQTDLDYFCTNAQLAVSKAYWALTWLLKVLDLSH